MPRFADFDSTRHDSRLQFYTVEKLGPNQALTPEGFLLCTNVPLARTGAQKYHPSEVDLPAGPEGYVLIQRNAEDVFHPNHIASYNGKSLVNEHPDRDQYPNGVVPEVWKELTVGVILNPRQGTGEDSDLLIADLLVTDPEAIQDVRDGKREVSCGYEADYEELQPGIGKQVNLIGNHTALVDAGRCGSRCAINDSRTLYTGDSIMPARKPICRKRINDRILKAWKDADENELKEALKENEKADDAEPGSGIRSIGDEGGEGDGTHVHIHTGSGEGEVTEERFSNHVADTASRFQDHEDRLSAIEAQLKGGSPAADSHTKDKATGNNNEEEIEGELKEEAPPGSGDAAMKAHDSVYLEDSFRATLSEAEILCPGIRLPTYDRAASPKTTFDSICSLRRRALDSVYATAEGKEMIEAIHGKSLEISKLRCGAVRPLFKAVVAMKKRQNHDTEFGVASPNASGGGLGLKGTIQSPADFNKRAAEIWEKETRH